MSRHRTVTVVSAFVVNTIGDTPVISGFSAWFNWIAALPVVIVAGLDPGVSSIAPREATLPSDQHLGWPAAIATRRW